MLEQQQVVFRHVEEQQVADNLTDQEATKLLIETLEHNGLPVPASLLDTPHTENTNLGSNQLDSIDSNLVNSNLLTKATEIVTSLISPSSDAPSQEATLPEAGTWQHTLMLNLFNAQQSVNMFLMDMFGNNIVDTNNIGGQFIKSDKVGQAAFIPNGDAASDVDENDDIVTSIAAIPESVSNAAYQLVKFVLPPSEASDTDSETYSEVSTGINPAHAAIGVLATGALGSVIYSYVATNPDIATSATNLAMGAIEGVKRRGIVSAAADTFAAMSVGSDYNVKNNNIGTKNYYYDDLIYADTGYNDYGYGYPSYDNDDTYYQTRDESEITDTISQQIADTISHKIPDIISHQIPDSISPQIPDTISHKIPDTVSHSVEFYEPEHNPWLLLGSGQTTDHLYRALYRRSI